MRHSIALALMALTPFGTASAQELPSGEVRIESMTYRGSGCAYNTVATNLSPDALALTMLFSDYQVDTSVRDGRPARKSCTLDLSVRTPAGWTFALLGTQVRGYVALDRGAIATQRTMATLAGSQPLDMGVLTVEGAYSGDYENVKEQPISTLRWSPCGTSGLTRLSLDTFIAVRPKAGFRDDQGETDSPALGRSLPKGLITVDSVDGAIDHLYTFAWKRCDDGDGGAASRDTTMTCMLRTGPRRIAESATSDSPEAARAAAIAKVLSTCRLATQGRPQQAAKCDERRVTCSFVQKRRGGGDHGGDHGDDHDGPGHGGPGHGGPGHGGGPGQGGPGQGGPGHGGPGQGNPGHGGPGRGGPGRPGR